jgi:hypothetical protein
MVKVLKSGNGQKEWSTKVTCTGEGNDGGGCGALLLVGRSDLYLTQSHARDETMSYVTFKCPECQVETDIEDGMQKVPYAIDLPTPRRGSRGGWRD